MTRVVLDACVMLDMMLAPRPRHAKARKLADLLLAKEISVHCPATVLVEMFAAAAQEFEARGRVPMPAGRPFANVWPFDLFIIPIDQKFVDQFVVPHGVIPPDAFPRGGDLPYLFIALTHDMPLITEDRGLRHVAERLNTAGFAVVVWDLDEAVEHLSSVD
jgi:hypothetical protein